MLILRLYKVESIEEATAWKIGNCSITNIFRIPRKVDTGRKYLADRLSNRKQSNMCCHLVHKCLRNVNLLWILLYNQHSNTYIWRLENDSPDICQEVFLRSWLCVRALGYQHPLDLIYPPWQLFVQSAVFT